MYPAAIHPYRPPDEPPAPPAIRARLQQIIIVVAATFRRVVQQVIAGMAIAFRVIRHCITRCCPGTPEARAQQIQRRELRQEHARQIDAFELEEEDEAPAPQPPAPPLDPIAPDEPFAVKLNAYTNMPREGASFMQRAVDIHRAILRGEDAQIPDDPAGGPAAPKMLDTFNQHLADGDADTFVLVLQLSIRAFLYTNRTLAEGQTPEFLKKDYRRGHVYRNTYQDLVEIRNLFRGLMEGEKVIIFNTLDTTQGIDGLPIGDDAKAVLRRINGISNELVQRNPDYNNALQALH